MTAIYLDNNATTEPADAVIEAVRAGLTTYWHNPSSVHRPGQAARQQVELARQDVARLIGVKARELTFTSGGTEAIDLAVRGILGAAARAGNDGASGRGPPLIVTSRVEHAAVRDLVEAMEKRGEARVRWLALEKAPGRRGVIDASLLAEQVTRDAALVCVQWANNETGAIQPVEAVRAACSAAGVPLLIDAVQWVGKMPVSAPGCDALVLSPHKFHGVKGVGVLWTRPGLRMRPVLQGSQELGRRGGTENVPGILGAGAAAREAMEWLAHPSRRDGVGSLRDWFEGAVLGAVPDARVNGPSGGRLWNTTNIAFPRLEAEALLLLLSERGVCASAGAACSSGSLEPSPVLLAMGVPDAEAHGSVRFSFSRTTTRGEVEDAARTLVECVQILSRSMPQGG
ncbi:MAG: cysteine desulfurase family protein [Phycisphaerales bacterium]